MSSDEEEFEFGAAEEEEVAAEEEEEEEEDNFIDDDDDDDAPLSGRKRRASSSKVDYNDDDDDDDDDEDDDDDDIPLAKLKSSTTKKKSAAKRPPAKKAKPVKKKIAAKKPEPKSKQSATSSSDNYRSIADAIFGTESVKGQLIQKLLCRWWYAIDWPTNIPDKPPKNYDAMDGIPGIFICTSGDKVGTIKDFRDMENKPSFSNFMSKDSSELKDLLLEAVAAQKMALVKAEGSGTPTEKELNDMLKWTKKVNADKADKEATKVLKKARMTLQ